jgi:hypothetical protein
MLRNSLAAFAMILAVGACPKDKGKGTTPVDTTKKPVDVPVKSKTIPPEIAEALTKAQAGCSKVHDEADPEKAKASYDAAAAQKFYEDECKGPLETALGKDATLASYKGDVSGKVIDVGAVKKMADATPGRIEIAKTTYEEAAKARKDEEKKIWEPLLKNDKLKIYQDKGVPTSSNATATDAAAVAQATIWIYESSPRDEKGKMVVDKTTYKFKKDGKADGKPKTEVTEYIAPE